MPNIYTTLCLNKFNCAPQFVLPMEYYKWVISLREKFMREVLNLYSANYSTYKLSIIEEKRLDQFLKQEVIKGANNDN